MHAVACAGSMHAPYFITRRIKYLLRYAPYHVPCVADWCRSRMFAWLARRSCSVLAHIAMPCFAACAHRDAASTRRRRTHTGMRHSYVGTPMAGVFNTGK